MWELEERTTGEAYRSQPDSAEDAYVDARVWDREDTNSSVHKDESSGESK